MGGLLAANRELEQALITAGTRATFSWMPGPYEWSVWNRSLDGFLRFWAGPRAPGA